MIFKSNFYKTEAIFFTFIKNLDLLVMATKITSKKKFGDF